MPRARPTLPRPVSSNYDPSAEKGPQQPETKVKTNFRKSARRATTAAATTTTTTPPTRTLCFKGLARLLGLEAAVLCRRRSHSSAPPALQIAPRRQRRPSLSKPSRETLRRRRRRGPVKRTPNSLQQQKRTPTSCRLPTSRGKTRGPWATPSSRLRPSRLPFCGEMLCASLPPVAAKSKSALAETRAKRRGFSACAKRPAPLVEFQRRSGRSSLRPLTLRRLVPARRRRATPDSERRRSVAPVEARREDAHVGRLGCLLLEKGGQFGREAFAVVSAASSRWRALGGEVRRSTSGAGERVGQQLGVVFGTHGCVDWLRGVVFCQEQSLRLVVVSGLPVAACPCLALHRNQTRRALLFRRFLRPRAKNVFIRGTFTTCVARI